jgi:hypothetical protein
MDRKAFSRISYAPEKTEGAAPIAMTAPNPVNEFFLMKSRLEKVSFHLIFF